MIALRNVRVIEPHPARVLVGVDIVVDRGLITAVGPGAASPASVPSAECFDLDGAWVMPGLICAHNHFYSALARGITTPIASSSSFVQQLEHLWWRLDRALDRDIVRASALVGALDAVACGATTVIDHHASPGFIRGSLAVLREAFRQVGLRGVLCYETTDRNGEEGAEEGVAENLDFARAVERERRADASVPLIEASIGGHAPFTLSDHTLEGLASAVSASGRGLHIHVAEDAYDVSYAHHVAGRDVLERLDAFGLLGPRSIVVHGVHLGQRDISILNERDAFLVHNPRSNMNNGVGYAARLSEVRNAALGTDGIGSDMLAEAGLAMAKAHDAGVGLGASDAARLLAGGFELASRAFGVGVGRMQPGCVADFVVLDYDPPTPLTEENVAGHLAFGLSSRHVRSVVIGGRWVYRDRRFPFDVAEIHADAREQARRLWERMSIA